MTALRQIGAFPIVIALHLLVLWALQSGLARDVVQAVQPVLFAQLLPAPVVQAPPAPEPPRPEPPQPRPRIRPQPAPPPPLPEPSENAITLEASPPAEPVAAAPAPTSQPAPVEPAPVELPVTPPSFHAAYLNNPAPEYPAASRRMGETGEVLLLVQVMPDGSPGEIRLRQGSGYTRLDEAALDAVRRWRFVPARQGDEPVAAWVLVPIRFSLK
ncbi:MAG TPA: energy transducer TonB [Nevskiales bacterium]|nr:energy transducer TonB [Nevskiales bacterium]